MNNIGLNQEDQDDDKEEREAEKQKSRDLQQQLKDARDGLEQGEMMFEYNVQGIILSSKLMWTRFESLMQCGFNEGQAMAIILDRGIN